MCDNCEILQAEIDELREKIEKLERHECKPDCLECAREEEGDLCDSDDFDYTHR